MHKRIANGTQNEGSYCYSYMKMTAALKQTQMPECVVYKIVDRNDKINLLVPLSLRLPRVKHSKKARVKNYTSLMSLKLFENTCNCVHSAKHNL